MKVHYSKILLFSLQLNILVSSSHVPNKNKPYITPHHTATTTSRVLSECDIYMQNYDNDPDMKSVKENFDRQTSQRFEEYNKRMKYKRQKCKEQCEKDIQQIIVKDKIQKSLVEKVEKCCLVCGCGLGGGVAPVWGLVSGLWYATWSQYVATVVPKAATDAGISEGLKVGLANVVKVVTKLSSGRANIPAMDVLQNITAGISSDNVTLYGIFKAIDSNGCGIFDAGTYTEFSTWVQSVAKRSNMLNTFSEQVTAVETAFNNAKTGIWTNANNVTNSLSTAIIASVVAIVVIALVMLIIYLILRYRRKKKMMKKLQYTKLLKE
ncbi:rifin [Plasmodium sp. gorilla clade G1]|nr:rifin [Plasmodium sp. gorilla clade G1]